MLQEKGDFTEFIDEELSWWCPLNTSLLEEDAFLNYMFEKRMREPLS